MPQIKRVAIVAIVAALAGCAPVEPSIAPSIPPSIASIAPASPAVAPPVDGGGAVGYLGCSMTRDAVNGYHLQGGTRLWPRLEIGGGSIKIWSDPKLPDVHGHYWGLFDDARALEPPVEVWWEVCRSDDEAALAVDDLYTAAEGVITQIRARLPGITIHVSAQPDYVEGHLCKATGVDGPAAARDIADRLVAAGLAIRAPDPPSLAAAQLVDQCHPAEPAQRLLGDHWIAYFEP